MNEIDDVFRQELEHLQQIRREEKEQEEKMLSAQLRNEAAEADGSSVECGCCLSDIAIENAVQCRDGHLFCADCLKVKIDSSCFFRIF